MKSLIVIFFPFSGGISKVIFILLSYIIWQN